MIFRIHKIIRQIYSQTELIMTMIRTYCSHNTTHLSIKSERSPQGNKQLFFQASLPSDGHTSSLGAEGHIRNVTQTSGPRLEMHDLSAICAELTAEAYTTQRANIGTTQTLTLADWLRDTEAKKKIKTISCECRSVTSVSSLFG